MFSFFKSVTKKKFFSFTSSIGSKISALFSRKEDFGNFLDQLEKILYESDLGVRVTSDLKEKIAEHIKNNPKTTENEILQIIQEEFLTIFSEGPKPSFTPPPSPYVILFVGVNGSGKTTSLIKLAHKYQKQGKKVLLGAADTFRAAATEQLSTWAEKLDIPIVKGQKNSDPSAVVFDTLSAGIARGAEIILIDTAGRLHTKTDLMQELEKIRRVCNKLVKGAPHETLLTLDSTIGQNAFDQASIFHKYTPIDAIFLAKLDGSAKGGMVVHIQKELHIPVKYVGIGESADDMKDFSKEEFINALLEIKSPDK
jgi:fused signal recognition particle receptor